ncbi:MAG TPA: phage holin family protein [Pyrinomonadaceae bacterium]|nr:phage holin family protein [Pyrinomonadaceae bacterium]
MSASAVRVNSTTVVSPETEKSDESLPSLFGRLGDDVMQLFDTKMSLLKVEIKEEASEYARDGVMIGAGGIIAAVGFALLNVALAFGISTLFANTDLSQAAKYAIGFLSAGVLYLIIGSVIIMTMKNRLAKQSLVPDRTVAELRKDKQWLKNEL